MTAAKPTLPFVQMALGRLDELMGAAVEHAAEQYGSHAARDSFRGLYLSGDDFDRLLDRPPGDPLLWVGSEAGALAGDLGLSGFDCDALLLALAPEIDLKYERLFGFLQDDITRRRPTVDLALHLLCPSAQARLLRRANFAPDSPLLARRLMRLAADPAQTEPPLLAHYLIPEPQAVAWLTGGHAIDSRIAFFCRLTPVGAVNGGALEAKTYEPLTRLARSARACRLFFEGLPRSGQAETAQALADELGLPLLAADLDRAAERRSDFEALLPAVFSDAESHDAVLFLEDPEKAPRRLLEELMEERRALTIGAGPRALPGWFPAPYGAVTRTAGRRIWTSCAEAAELCVSEEALDRAHARLHLTPAQIARTVETARHHTLLRGASQVEMEDIMAAARSHCGHELAALARRVRVRHGWDDIVLPADTIAQLREMCRRAEQQRRVLEDWGFERSLSGGTGVSALFAGPSGSGKTMAVEVLSSELRLDAYKIDLSGVVSKYIGETEKNLERIFAAADHANAILFFDEADALFGKRSEVRDSHDRYANIEISYLLQRMEEYSGIAILATNLRQNLDDAFVRRLTFSVHFPFPDEAARERIWKRIWPATVPLAADLDCAALARQFPLSGGNIRNIALAAAFLAAGGEEPVAMRHVLHALQREYQKYGKRAHPGELLSGTSKEVAA